MHIGGKRRCFSQEEIQTIRDLAAQDIGIPEIGRRIARKDRAIWTLMKRLGIPRRPHYNKLHKGENMRHHRLLKPLNEKTA